MVLPPRSVEVEPEVGWIYRESGERRRDTIVPTLSFRIGLPWGAQADVRLPFVAFDHESGVGTSSGLGDVVVGLTKLLVAENRVFPELLLGARWKTTSGQSGGSLPTGSGIDGIQAVLTASKQKAPVVLTGSAYYFANLPSDGVDRGDAAGVTLTTVLAATPDVSLLAGIDVATFSETTVGGRSLPGTDRVGGIVNLGLSTVLTRRVAVNVTAGIGVTHAAPPLQLTTSLPVRC